MLKNSSIISAKWSNLIFVRLRPLDDEANRRREDDGAQEAEGLHILSANLRSLTDWWLEVQLLVYRWSQAHSAGRACRVAVPEWWCWRQSSTNRILA